MKRRLALLTANFFAILSFRGPASFRRSYASNNTEMEGLGISYHTMAVVVSSRLVSSTFGHYCVQNSQFHMPCSPCSCLSTQSSMRCTFTRTNLILNFSTFVIPSHPRSPILEETISAWPGRTISVPVPPYIVSTPTCTSGSFVFAPASANFTLLFVS